MMMDMPEIPTYPALGFLVKHGKAIAGAVAALPLLGAIAAVAAGAHPLLLVAGLVACPVLLLFMLTYVEMARVISDTMIPR